MAVGIAGVALSNGLQFLANLSAYGERDEAVYQAVGTFVEDMKKYGRCTVLSDAQYEAILSEFSLFGTNRALWSGAKLVEDNLVNTITDVASLFVAPLGAFKTTTQGLMLYIQYVVGADVMGGRDSAEALIQSGPCLAYEQAAGWTLRDWLERVHGIRDEENIDHARLLAINFLKAAQYIIEQFQSGIMYVVRF